MSEFTKFVNDLGAFLVTWAAENSSGGTDRITKELLEDVAEDAVEDTAEEEAVADPVEASTPSDDNAPVVAEEAPVEAPVAAPVGRTEADRVQVLRSLSVEVLKAAAIQSGYDEADVAEADKDTLVEALTDEDITVEDLQALAATERPAQDLGAPDRSADPAEAAKRDAERKRLMSMPLMALQLLAKRRGFSQREISGRDVCSLADIILDSGDTSHEVAEKLVEIATQPENPYAKQGFYTPDDFIGKSIAELKRIAKVDFQIDARKLNNKSAEQITALLKHELLKN